MSRKSPSELSRAIKPVLNSLYKTKRRLSQTPFFHYFAEIPEEVFVQNVNQEIKMSIQIAFLNAYKQPTKVDILLDSGANAIFIDHSWVKKLKLLHTKLWHAIPIFNVMMGLKILLVSKIMHTVDLMIEYQGCNEKLTVEVMDLRKNALILKFTWLNCHNLEIDWVKGFVTMTYILPQAPSCPSG